MERKTVPGDEKEKGNLVKKYSGYIITFCAIAFGALMAHISWDSVIMPMSPTMIIDMNVPSEVSPLGYEPIEITGASTGVKKVVTCNVPVEYAPYIHYPKAWDISPMNPQSWVGKFTKYFLYFLLAVVLILFALRIYAIYQERKSREMET